MTVPSRGLPPRCSDCGEIPKLDVGSTPAGYYVGLRCACSPYSRESGYYRTREAAEKALADGSYRRR